MVDGIEEGGESPSRQLSCRRTCEMLKSRGSAHSGQVRCIVDAMELSTIVQDQ